LTDQWWSGTHLQQLASSNFRFSVS
jgi:hypothetical protein